MQAGKIGPLLGGLVLYCGTAAVRAELLGPSPYLSFADSPFNGINFLYFHLEDFEDHMLNTPGVSASTGGVTSVVFGPSSHDSVDADDGEIDGDGSLGDSYFSIIGSSGIAFEFDGGILGSLPDAVGLVWTDGQGEVEFEAFDANGVSLGVVGAGVLEGGGSSGQTDEDRFFGVFEAGGISRVFIKNQSGGIEIDHLQYGRIPLRIFDDQFESNAKTQ